MKFILLLFLAIVPITDFNDIAEINELKKEAKEAYLNGDYPTAITKYNTLIGAYGVQDENVKLNLAHAHYKNDDLESAFENYSQLLASNDPDIRSSAYNQMGLIANQQQKSEEALSHFKDALKADSSNEEARYNYSMLKKKLEEQQKQEQNKDQQQNKEEQKKENEKQQGEEDKKQEQGEESEEQKEEGEETDKEQEEQQKQNQDKQGQEGEQEEGEEQEETDQLPQTTEERLKEMDISEEKAKMILEAMKNSEIQYLQQNQRESRSRSDSGKPDW